MISLKEAADFLSLLNKNNVQYLIIGGVAVNVHGFTRATGDLDIWYNPSKENFHRLLTTIKTFGFDVAPIEKLENYDPSSHGIFLFGNACDNRWKIKLR